MIRGRTSIKKYFRNSSAEESYVLCTEYFASSVHGRTVLEASLRELLRSIPAGVVAILIYNRTPDGLRATLTPSGEERPVGEIVKRKRVPQEDNMARVHHGSPQITLDFLDE
jgi:hypothetical protein